MQINSTVVVGAADGTARPAVRPVTFAQDAPIAVFAGPCQMESREHALMMAAALKEIANKLGIGLVYKTSFDKANRTSLSGKRGIGLDAAIPVFAEIRETLGLPIVTDVHEIEQCARVAEVVDVLQIPAFLCRQTDLLIAAAKTGRVVKIKKGQFLAPWDMKHVAAKIASASRAAGPAAAAGEGAPHLDGSALGLLWVVPFVGILLSIALMPLAAPSFWHHHFGKVSAFWGLAFLGPFAAIHGVPHATYEM
jgi:hypothetical protein